MKSLRRSRDMITHCEKCGDIGYSELLVYCKDCNIYAEHRYCLDKLPESDEVVVWSCEECSQCTSEFYNDFAAPLNVCPDTSLNCFDQQKSLKLGEEVKGRIGGRKKGIPILADDNRLNEDGEPLPFVQHQKDKDADRTAKDFGYVYSKPVLDPVWRGSFSSHGRDYGRVTGHLSSKASYKVYEGARMLESRLQVELLPRSEAWPKSFSLAPPTDDHIGLYFFPENRDEIVFHELVGEINDFDLMMRVAFDRVELLLFSSQLLPLSYWKCFGKYYLWGVFKRKQIPLSSATIIGSLCGSVLEKNEMEHCPLELLNDRNLCAGNGITHVCAKEIHIGDDLAKLHRKKNMQGEVASLSRANNIGGELNLTNQKCQGEEISLEPLRERNMGKTDRAAADTYPCERISPEPSSSLSHEEARAENDTSKCLGERNICEPSIMFASELESANSEEHKKTSLGIPCTVSTVAHKPVKEEHVNKRFKMETGPVFSVEHLPETGGLCLGPSKVKPGPVSTVDQGPINVEQHKQPQLKSSPISPVERHASTEQAKKPSSIATVLQDCWSEEVGHQDSEMLLKRQQSVLKTFMSTKMAVGSSISDHIEKMMRYVQDLENLGINLASETQIKFILKSVPKCFEPFIDKLMRKRPQLSTDQLLCELDAVESGLKMKNFSAAPLHRNRKAAKRAQRMQYGSRVDIGECASKESYLAPCASDAIEDGKIAFVVGGRRNFCPINNTEKMVSAFCGNKRSLYLDMEKEVCFSPETVKGGSAFAGTERSFSPQMRIINESLFFRSRANLPPMNEVGIIGRSSFQGMENYARPSFLLGRQNLPPSRSGKDFVVDDTERNLYPGMWQEQAGSFLVGHRMNYHWTEEIKKVGGERNYFPDMENERDMPVTGSGRNFSPKMKTKRNAYVKRCLYCGKVGHSQIYCWFQKRALKKQLKQSRPT